MGLHRSPGGSLWVLVGLHRSPGGSVRGPCGSVQVAVDLWHTQPIELRAQVCHGPHTSLYKGPMSFIPALV